MDNVLVFQPWMCYIKSYSLEREVRRLLVYCVLAEVLLGSVGRERNVMMTGEGWIMYGKKVRAVES